MNKTDFDCIIILYLGKENRLTFEILLILSVTKVFSPETFLQAVLLFINA